MRARVLLALLVLGVITSAVAGCKRREAGAPAMGTESTTVDTTKKQ